MSEPNNSIDNEESFVLDEPSVNNDISRMSSVDMSELDPSQVENEESIIDDDMDALLDEPSQADISRIDDSDLPTVSEPSTVDPATVDVNVDNTQTNQASQPNKLGLLSRIKNKFAKNAPAPNNNNANTPNNMNISETNIVLLQNMEQTVSDILNNLTQNDEALTKLLSAYQTLKDAKTEVDKELKELRDIVATNTPDAIKAQYINRIEALEKEKEQTTLLIHALKKQIDLVNQKVKQQSNQLQNMSATGGKAGKSCHFQKKLNHLKSMKRSDLDKLAKKWGLNPEVYPRKSDIINALQLMAYASMLKLTKRPKGELIVLAKNLGVDAKTKTELVKKLERKMSSVKI